jgi:hypothetical protein
MMSADRLSDVRHSQLLGRLSFLPARREFGAITSIRVAALRFLCLEPHRRLCGESLSLAPIVWLAPLPTLPRWNAKSRSHHACGSFRLFAAKRRWDISAERARVEDRLV